MDVSLEKITVEEEVITHMHWNMHGNNLEKYNASNC